MINVFDSLDLIVSGCKCRAAEQVGWLRGEHILRCELSLNFEFVFTIVSKVLLEWKHNYFYALKISTI